jgi:hypothetical protein
MLRLILAATLALTAVPAMPVEAKDKGCPPGLAKKDPPCIPPGQAKKQRATGNDRDWRVGDRIDGDYVLIPRSEWERLALRDYLDGSTYLRIDDQVLRVVRDTLIVLEAVEIVGGLLD